MWRHIDFDILSFHFRTKTQKKIHNRENYWLVFPHQCQTASKMMRILHLAHRVPIESCWHRVFVFWWWKRESWLSFVVFPRRHYLYLRILYFVWSRYVHRFLLKAKVCEICNAWYAVEYVENSTNNNCRIRLLYCIPFYHIGQETTLCIKKKNYMEHFS